MEGKLPVGQSISSFLKGHKLSWGLSFRPQAGWSVCFVPPTANMNYKCRWTEAEGMWRLCYKHTASSWMENSYVPLMLNWDLHLNKQRRTYTKYSTWRITGGHTSKVTKNVIRKGHQVLLVKMNYKLLRGSLTVLTPRWVSKGKMPVRVWSGSCWSSCQESRTLSSCL